MRSFVSLAVSAILAMGLIAPAAGAAPAGPDRPVLDTIALTSLASKAAGVREISGKRFAMVAVRANGPVPDGIEVQARKTDGSWGSWLRLEKQDDATDQRKASKGTEPVWVGDSTALRVRAGDPAGLSVVLIDPGATRTATASPRTGGWQGGPANGRPMTISRAEWGADERVRTDCFARQGIGVEYSSTVKSAAIHHTAGTNDYTAADSARIVRGIYAYHAINLDWCDIGYNVLVDKYGQIFEGRVGGLDVPVWGAHAGGFNQFATGVSMLGTFTDVAPTSAQLTGVAQFLAWKFAFGYRDPNGRVRLTAGGNGSGKYPPGAVVDLPTIFAHRDVDATECPGTLGYAQLPALREKATAIMGDWTARPIYRKWQATGGDAGPLGGVYAVEAEAGNGGARTTFDSGNKSVYWSQATGAQIIYGMIRDRWLALGGETAVLGYPTTDELGAAAGGRYNDFQGAGGSIYWSPNTGAHQIMGRIKEKWVAFGKEGGDLGYPLTDELTPPDGYGRFNHFQGVNGSIYWTNATGAHEVRGMIKQRWSELGWELSYLGYPVSDEYPVPGGRRSDFQGGSLVWDAATGRVSELRR